jgi:hypothetical protein
MTALRKLRPQSEPRSSHRIYRDPNPTGNVFCRLVNNEAELLGLAAGIDRIEVRQSPGSGWIPNGMIDAVVEAIRAIHLVGDSGDPRAERMAREMRRRMIDALARIRIRWNRRVLAGSTRIFRGDTESVLLLVFSGPGITSCEWHLAP